MNPYQQIKKDFEGKRILVMGLGVQGGGVGVVNFFNSIGCTVKVTDLRSEDELKSSIEKIQNQNIQFTLAKHQEQDFLDCDVVIRNPGVRSDNSYLKLARQNNIPIYMETALFAKYSQKPIIGITGTRGKTTTTTLIHSILKDSTNKKIQLAGNIPGSSTIELLEEESDQVFVTVLELSSWQLQGFNDLKISPHIAVLTNIFPDHLNRYNSMDDYILDKAVISKFQTKSDYLIYNNEDKVVKSITNKSKAISIPFTSTDIPSQITLKLQGVHNRANAAAATKVAKLFDISDESINKVLSNHSQIPYRLELISNFEGVDYINDTTSTTPVALEAAIKAQSKNCIVIVGGQAKNLPTDQMINTLNNSQKVKGIILIPGSGTDQIREKLNQSRLIADTKTLEEAVAIAKSKAENGEVVLFSPGFTSFDQYKNEFERGSHFNKIIRSTFHE